MADSIADHSPGVSSSTQEKGSSRGWLNPTKWIEVIGSVVTGGLGYAPREQVGIIMIAFLLVAVMGLIGIGFIYSGNSTIAGGIIPIMIIALVAAMFFIRPTAK